MFNNEIPGILVAMPEIKDPYFEKTVILLCNFNVEGAFGLIMNHPSTTKVKEVLTEDVQAYRAFDVPLLVGGPVQPESFWAVHSSDFKGDSTTDLSKNICLSSGQDILSAIIDGQEVEYCHFGSGYAGWGPEQLDHEIEDESWWLGPLDEQLLLQMDYDSRWQSTLDNLGIDPLTTSFSQTGMV